MSDTPCKPVFVQPLRDTTITEGQKLKLHAAVKANPEPEVNDLSVSFYAFYWFFAFIL